MSSTKLDITVLNSNVAIGSKECNVAAGATTIYPGEPVAKTLGGVTVTAAADATPVVGTDYFEGIATDKSTQTATAAGKVSVMPLLPGTIYLIDAKSAADVDTQAEYDALVGKRLVLDLTSGKYTIDTTAGDGATNGCVVQALDIKAFPGKVAFSFRNGVSVLS